MKIRHQNLFNPLITFLVLFLMTSIAQADKRHWGYTDNSSYSSSPVQIDIIDDRGRILNTYSTDSRDYRTQRTYLEAVKGKRYKLRLRNTSNRRVGLVIAVDGRNILSGKKSYLRPNEKMYVLDPYETVNYKGWRTGKNRVNRFYFTSAGNSYANAWGDRSALGVIAVAVFEEKHRQYYKKHRKDFSNKLAPSRRGNFAEESTGTGFGREEYSPTVKVYFKPKRKPVFKHFIKYEWRDTLCKRGIVRCNYYENDNDHNRFWPRETYNNRRDEYAPYPPNYYLKDWQSNTRSWDEAVTKDDDFWWKRNW